MKGFEPEHSFDEDVARTYDDVSLRGDEDAAVEFLAVLAGNRRTLELAIGTGRIALPLAAHGVSVEGIDISGAMVARMRAKPGGAAIPVTIGNFRDVAVEGSYGLVYVVFNTLFNLLTQDDQVRCFQNVAQHLEPGGRFVVEAFVPTFLYRLRDNQYVDAEHVGHGAVRLDVGRHDPVSQTLDESHVSISATGIRLTPIVTRYAWPGELDLMARLAGLRLHGRWGGWNREAFTGESRLHVSVWEKP
ncbi:MAG: class I SAM-dependent methyltransferase [Dehalococcoidia bacterium]|nr:class I SAM-dependent methyltransferase [Dehalococcoidia bacterium]MCB9486669.1 class I SAM-dependent methyltransferase [Thermoflexaceae bacterium]